MQGTLPTNPKHPTKTRMWRGVIASYSFVAMCVFPLAIGGYWAYGNMVDYFYCFALIIILFDFCD